MDDSDLKRALSLGRTNCDLPPIRSRVVRIFTSSTFTDTYVERNALMQDVYPKLRDYCKSKYGLEFQVVDMRWGVRDEATDDHMTSQLCMNEIEECKRISDGPTFVVFLCQKYGYRPFPAKIPAEEFESMRNVLTREGKSVDVMDEWFQKDNNAVPPVYVLQKISSKLCHFNDNGDPDKMAKDRAKWEDVRITLQEKLRHASTICSSTGAMSVKVADKYKISVTHDEVMRGLFDASLPREDHCLCFIRKFKDLENKTVTEEVRQFLDITSTDEIDEEAQLLLSDLRDKLVPKVLPKSNVFESVLSNWSSGGVNVDILEHKEYLDTFLHTFYEKLISLIAKGVERDKNNISKDPMFEEIMQHLIFCKLKCKLFYGRNDLLSGIEDYINGRLEDNTTKSSPMVIYGQSGSGKTSVMAKAALCAGSEWYGLTQAAIILRFIGTTPASTSIRQLIKSVCLQILTIYDDTQHVPSDYFQLVRLFSQLLQYATKEKPIVIFLDSLDQLSPADGAYRMAWLPRYLPPYVAMIVSTLPNENNILTTLRSILSSTMTRYAEVKELSTNESLNTMTSWLQSKERVITSEQQRTICHAIQKCSLPLYLKLLFDQASSWQSYIPDSKINLQTSVKGMIAVIFDRLEEYHGKALVSHALSYMTISQNGIGEAELEDLLSLDDEVLQEVYAYWLPPTRRIPPLLWTRIRADINDYLVEREADGLRTIYWYHRQFIETVRERYLQDINMLSKFHQLCTEYYLGTWSGGRAKPFEYTEEQVKKFMRPKQAEADRKVEAQPLKFSDDMYNIRKLQQLPYHLIHARDVDKLKEHVLCNFDFIITKLKGMSLADILQDFTMALEEYDDDAIRSVDDLLRVGASTLREDPDYLAIELIGRLKSSQNIHIAKLISDAEKSSLGNVPLIPYNQCYPEPGGLLRTQLSCHSDEVLSLAHTSDGRFLVSGSKDMTAIVWDLENSTPLHTLKGHHQHPITKIGITADNLLTVTYGYGQEYTNDEIHVWNIETGEHFLELNGHTGMGRCDVRFTQDSKFAVSDMFARIKEKRITYSHYFIVWSLENGKQLYEKVELKGKINEIVLATMSDGRQVIVTCGERKECAIEIWNLLTGELIKAVMDRRRIDHRPCKKMAVSSNGQLIAFHFHHPGILDVNTGEFIYICDDTGDPKMVCFFNEDKEVIFQRDHISLYSIAEKRVVRSLKMYGGSSKEIKEICFTKDLVTIVSVHDGFECATVWNSHMNEQRMKSSDCELLSFLPHNKQINSIRLIENKHSTFAVTGSADKNINVWNIASLLKSANQGSKLDYSKDTKTYSERKPLLKHITHRLEVLDNEQRVAVIDNHGQNISLYDISNGKEIATQKWEGTHKHELDGLASMSDGKRLFAIGFFALREYNTVNLKPLSEKPKRLDPNCNSILIPGDGSMSLLLGGSNYVDTIYIYDINKEWYMETYRPPSRPQHIFILSGHRMLLPCTNDLAMVDLTTGDSIYSHHYRQRSGDSSLICGAIASDESMLITGWDNGHIKVIKIESGEIVYEFQAHEITKKKRQADIISEIALSSDDFFFVSSSSDNTSKLWWNIKSLELRHVFHGHTSPVNTTRITADNLYVLTSASAEMNVKVWSVASGHQLTAILGYSPIDGLYILPQTNKVIITTSDERVMFFNVCKISNHAKSRNVNDQPAISVPVVPSENRVPVIRNTAPGTQKGDLNHQRIQNRVPLPPIISEPQSNELKLPNQALKVKINQPLPVTLATPRNYYATSPYQQSPTKTFSKKHIGLKPRTLQNQQQEDTVRDPLVLYSKSKQTIGGPPCTQLVGHYDEVLSLAVTSDGKYLVSSSKDMMVMIWDLENNSPLYTLEGYHRYPILKISVTPNDLLAITYGYGQNIVNDEIMVFNIKDGEHAFDLKGHYGVRKCEIQFTNDSKYAVSDLITKIKEGRTTKYKYYFIVWSLKDGKQIYDAINAHTGTT
uniref:NACHT and WD repeat domain-containing protein 1-like n=1 Tax=Saccoglossus kowalevskii TaxID=10224 RepID=A0ABM0MZA4_SACKO|nr:PREDICTED: NACHT and WD repeat domain-containing protein 1-like [Saccoglossus kowalevskii]